eukprot:334306-Pelagomonas_calceolata.AAC.5
MAVCPGPTRPNFSSSTPPQVHPTNSHLLFASNNASRKERGAPPAGEEPMLHSTEVKGRLPGPVLEAPENNTSLSEEGLHRSFSIVGPFKAACGFSQLLHMLTGSVEPGAGNRSSLKQP